MKMTRASVSPASAGLEGQRPGLIKAQGNALGINAKLTQALKGRLKSRAIPNETPFQGLGYLLSDTRGVAPGYYETGRWPSEPLKTTRCPE